MSRVLLAVVCLLGTCQLASGQRPPWLRGEMPVRMNDTYYFRVVSGEGSTPSGARRAAMLELVGDLARARGVTVRGSGLELREDAVGLYARAVVTDPEVVDEARRGRLRGWSFGFRALRQSDGERGGLRHRTLREIELREVSLLDDSRVPAYPATSVFTRDDGEEMEVRTMQDLVETSEEAPPAPDLSPWTDVVRELEQRAL